MPDFTSSTISIEEARPYYKNDIAHDFDHVLRVLKNAQHIAQHEPADPDILQTAVLLHDIGRAEQARTGEDHAQIGSRMARDILSQAPPAFVDAVCHAIETHRYRTGGPPQTQEAKILFDADKLDSLGAVGIARAFAYAGHKHTRLWTPFGSDEPSPTREFEVKLVKVKDRLFTPTAKKLAEIRHDFMVQFFAELQAEIEGD